MLPNPSSESKIAVADFPIAQTKKNGIANRVKTE